MAREKMRRRFMSHKANDIFDQNHREAMEEAGLAPVGKNEEGEDEFLGTEEEWDNAPEPSQEEVEEVEDAIDQRELENY